MIPEYRRIDTFNFGGKDLEVMFVETMEVRPGVLCDVYQFRGDNTKDLAIIRVEAGAATPQQRVSRNMAVPIDFTEEGYVEGEGSLVIDRAELGKQTYEVNPQTGRFSIRVERGEKMKWRAGETGLVAYEVCQPPYQRGRFEDLD